MDAAPDAFLEATPVSGSADSPSAFRQIHYVNADHVGAAFSSMNAMRRSGLLCDIALEVGDAQLRAHKVVLAATSAYFNAMFTSE